MENLRRFGSHRMIPEDNSISSGTTLGLILFVTSVAWYRRVHIKEKDYFNLAVFSAASFFTSMVYGRFFLENSYTAAARRNNWRELKH